MPFKNWEDVKYQRERADRELAEQRLAKAVAALVRAEELISDLQADEELNSPPWLREVIRELTSNAQISGGTSSAEADCSAIDNSFTSVLWRRLSADMRLHTGWTMEACERNFRKIVNQTLVDNPPNDKAQLRTK
jgi:hypothetical protein